MSYSMERVEELLEEISEKLDDILVALEVSKRKNVPVQYNTHVPVSSVTNYCCPKCGMVIWSGLAHVCNMPDSTGVPVK